MPLLNIIVPSLFLIAGLALSSCATPPATQSPTFTLTPPALTPYSTATFTVTPSGLPPTSTPLPTATPTPVTYTVKKDEDMFGIALRFGVSLPALKTANPTVNPYFLSVGMVLVIPVTPSPPASPVGTPGLLTSTPGPLKLTSPVCYPTAGQGLWCLVEARNTSPVGVEALGVKFRLSSPGSGKLIEQTVFAPLNVLPGSGHLPVSAYFASQGNGQAGVEASIESSLPLAEDQTRYPAVQIEDQQISITGRLARASGKISLLSTSSHADEVWIVAAAYGTDSALVGMRRWESPASLKGGETLPFSIDLYSLGPQIERVEVFAEAHARLTSLTPTATP